MGQRDGSNGIFLKNAWLCRLNGRSVQPVFVDVSIAEGKIRQIQPPGRTPPPAAEYEIIDARGRVVTPPLVNFHEHIYSRLAKGLNPQGPTNSFRQILENFWWPLDQALDLPMIGVCARLCALESIRSGVSYLFDHHSSPNSIEGSLVTIANALRRHFLRGVLCFETSDRQDRARAVKSLEENRAFIRYARDSDLRGMVGLHAPFTLSNESLEQAAKLCRELEVGLHIHLSESKDDPEQSRKLCGISPAARLESFGLLQKPLSTYSILAHGVHLDQEEYSRIGASCAALAYCPDSNMNNSVGLPEYARVPAEVSILAGTDGMHANVARSLKQLFLLHRHQGNSMEASFLWFEKLFFDQVRFVRNIFPDYPSLEEGDRADLLIWDYQPPTPFGADNFWGHYIYGVLESPASWLLQKGRVLLREGRLAPDLAPNPAEWEDVVKQGQRLFGRFRDG